MARAGETVSYQVTAKLEPGFHIYQYAKKSAEDGPENTQFDLFDTAGLEVAGDWTASRPPIRKKEEVFPKLEFVEFFEDEVTWSIPLRVPPGPSPGRRPCGARPAIRCATPRVAASPASGRCPMSR